MKNIERHSRYLLLLCYYRIIVVITSAKEVVFLVALVCLFVCLFVSNIT